MAADPYKLICPDYITEEYTAARAIFVTDTVSQAQAAGIPAQVWIANNDTAKVQWQQSINESAAAAVEALRLQAEAEAVRRACIESERVEAEKEALKRNRVKNISILERHPPLRQAINPAPYPLRKLQKGEYIELYYFTNQGLTDTKKSSAGTDEEALVPITDPFTKTMSWIPAAAKRDSSFVIQDKDLSWEQFSIAVPRLMDAMNNADWTQQCRNMLAVFWSGLLNHEYHSSPKDLDIKTLLVYQAEQQSNWHEAIDTPISAWDISIINEDIMQEVSEQVYKEHHDRLDSEMRLRVSVLHFFYLILFSSRSITEAPCT